MLFCAAKVARQGWAKPESRATVVAKQLGQLVAGAVHYWLAERA